MSDAGTPTGRTGHPARTSRSVATGRTVDVESRTFRGAMLMQFGVERPPVRALVRANRQAGCSVPVRNIVAVAGRAASRAREALAAVLSLVAALAAVVQDAVCVPWASSVEATADRAAGRARTPLLRMVVSLVIAPGAPGVPVAA